MAMAEQCNIDYSPPLTAKNIEPIVHDDFPEAWTGPQTAGALTSFDVFAFIVNKMVGTGIFTVPPTILLLTHSRQITIILWSLGFVYAIVSTFLYLAFCAVLPYSTGELNYIDEATSYGPRSKPVPLILNLFGDGLLAYTVYSFLFVALFNNGTNTLQVGHQILIGYRPQEEPNRDLTRFMGIVCLTTVCLIHYFSARAGRAANRVLCVMKLGLMIMLLCAGTKRAIQGPKIAYPSAAEVQQSPPPFSNYPKALLLVLFSFQGWENASFIAGEISHRSPNTLRNGFIWAVLVTGLLYLFINLAYVYSVDIDGQISAEDTKSYVAQLFGNSLLATRCWAIAIAISASGSLIAVIYTFARVKHAIGNAKILPLSSIWKQECPEYRSSDNELEKTPKGGLILHWISAVVMISSVAPVANTSEMIAYPGFLQTYGHALVAMAITIGLPALRSRAKALDREEAGFKWIWRSEGLSKIPIWTVLLCYLAVGVFMVVGFLVTPSSGTIPRWTAPVIVFSCVFLGVTYYSFLFLGPASNLKNGFSLFCYAGVEVKISKVQHYRVLVDENARRYGTRRTISYNLSSSTNDLYMIFGGSRADKGFRRWFMWEYWMPMQRRFRSLFKSHRRKDSRS